MAVEVFLLFALAVIYTLISYGHSPIEHRAESHGDKDEQWRHSRR
jgi:hypothetical protein